MVTVRTESGQAIFEIEGTHKLWALRSSLTIPLEHIQGVHVEPDPPMGFLGAVKIMGTDVPRMFRAGSFYQVDDHGVVFYDVRHKDHCIVVELAHERFEKLYLEVEDPPAAVHLLEDARRRAGARP